MSASETIECELLFVYGTLLSGFSLHGNLKRFGASYVGRGNNQGELFDLGSFPGARRSEMASKRVVGEIYRLSNPRRAFTILDEIEGCRSMNPESSLFRRETTLVTLANGKEVTAWVYWLNREQRAMQRIPSGDYAAG